MWICPVCKNANGEGLLCEKCGFDESLHYKKYRTLAEVEGSGEAAHIYELCREVSDSSQKKEIPEGGERSGEIPKDGPERPEDISEEKAGKPEAFREKTKITAETEKTEAAGRTDAEVRRKRTRAAVLAAVCVALLAAVAVMVLHTGNSADRRGPDQAGAMDYAGTEAAAGTAGASPADSYEAGDEIRFGAYEQDGDRSNGKEDIEWIVLEKIGSRVLVLSKYCLNVRPYDEEGDALWENCSLRRWLNEEFLEEAFGEEERAQICYTNLVDYPAVHEDGTDPINDTDDQIFLLSQEEVYEYFYPVEESRTSPTEHAKKQGAVFEGNADWWLRISDGTCYAVVDADGRIAIGVYADGFPAYVRPAMWIELGTSAGTESGENEAGQGNAEETEGAAYPQSFSELEVGSRFPYGTYEQDGDGSNGREGIEWLVLDRVEDRALVVSEYGLDVRPYDGTFEAATWETCSLRSWLNGAFLEEAFGTEEQGRIREKALTNPDNAEYGTEGGSDTVDRVFLLSMEEAERYFSSEEERQASPTEYAKAQGAYVGDNGNADWWLRSPGASPHGAGGIDAGGGIFSGSNVGSVDDSVRPVLWMNVSAADTDVGDTVHFGRYEQDNNAENGKEEIEWTVLDRQDDSILVISKYCLDVRPYHSDRRDVTWETCSLRGWLNSSFLTEAFSGEEQGRILETTVGNPDNAEFGTAGGNDTTDKLFLLSTDEVRRYFPSEEERRLSATAYAKKLWAYVGDNGGSWWWLRSPGFSQEDAVDVLASGEINDSGNYVDGVNGTVRPAMWIDLGP